MADKNIRIIFSAVTSAAQSGITKLKIAMDKMSNSTIGKITGKFVGFGTSAVSSIKNVAASIFSLGGVLSTGALLYGLNKITEAAENQRKVLAQTDAVLKSTGGAANVTAQEVNNLARELQKVTNFGDEVTQSGQNILLTFTKIGGDIFPQATETMLNLSASMNQGVKESAIQLGKALNEPIQGITALRRVGIQFSDSQEEQIKAFVSQNKLLDAQKIILKELETQFGGSARAQASYTTQFKNVLGDLMESFGRLAGPVLIPVIKKLTELTESFIEIVDKTNIDPLVVKLKTGLIDIQTVFKITFESIKEIISEPFKLSTYTTIFDSFVDGTSNLVSKIKNAAKSGFVGLKKLRDEIKESEISDNKSLEDEIIQIKKDAEEKKLKLIQEYQNKQKELKENNIQTNVSVNVEENKGPGSNLADQENLTFEKRLQNLRTFISEQNQINEVNAEKQIELYRDLGEKFAETEQQKLVVLDEIDAVQKQREEEKFLTREEMGQLKLDQEMFWLEQTKAVRDVDEEEQLERLNRLLQSEVLTEEQKRQTQLKTFQLQQQMRQKDLQNAQFIYDQIQGSFQNMLEGNESSFAESGKAILKHFINMKSKELLLSSLSEIGKAKIEAPGTFGASLLKIPLILAAQSAANAALNSIKLAQGGIVKSSPGGTLATIGEAGKDEVVIPLDDESTQDRLGFPDTINVKLSADNIEVLAKGFYEKTTRLIRTGEISERGSI